MVHLYIPPAFPIPVEVKDECHRIVAAVATWSMRHALMGVYPCEGPFGEKLDGKRGSWAGKPIASGYSFAYLGFRSDAKARKECHRFDRTYQHNQICEGCLAERPNKNGDPILTFKNFYGNAAHLLTNFSHDEYLRTTAEHSPWEDMPGFHLKSIFRDPMHTIFLGTAKELLASCLGYWCRNGYVDGANLDEQLRGISAKQKACCKAAGMRATFRTFTPSNTGLLSKSEYPELGPAFKATTVKVMIWFFSTYATELVATSAEDWGLYQDGGLNKTCFKFNVFQIVIYQLVF